MLQKPGYALPGVYADITLFCTKIPMLLGNDVSYKTTKFKFKAHREKYVLEKGEDSS